MGFQQLLFQPNIQRETLNQDLVSCNKKSEQYGLSFTYAQIEELAKQRIEVLREVRRVEFGRGQLVELVSAFCSSPYLRKTTYAETMVELQRIFYQLKEESGEQIPDEELIEAMRLLFDTEAHGSLDYFEGVSSDVLQASIERFRQDAYEDWSEEKNFQEKKEGSQEKEKGVETSFLQDGLDRVYEGGNHYRPDNEYAGNFYNAYDELYQKRFDFNSRIGGSGL